MDPRQYFPAYGTGNYYQKMDYFVKDEKVPISDSEEYFIALPNNNNGFNLKVENLELNCSDCTVIITKKMINLREVTSVSISGDYGFVTFENGFFDGKDIKIKVRGLTKVGLGNSCVRSINIDSQMGTIDSSNITKL